MIFVFQSTRRPDVFAYTRDRGGAILPPELGPWRRQEGIAIPSGEVSADDPVIQKIEAEGYILARSEIVRGIG